MSETNRVAIVTYNGLDGACAAAAVLLKHPEAEVYVTSAAGICLTLAALDKEEAPPSEIHVCGLGVWCDWAEVTKSAESLRAKGCRIFWYCGRGYLDAERVQFERISTPVFVDAGANTEAVCRHLELADHPEAKRLLKLARHDPLIRGGKSGPRPGDDQSLWMDFVDASISQYFKYQDNTAYVRAIRKLALGERDRQDERMVDAYRLYGMRYVLQGKSKVMQRLREMIARCAEADEHVLITGESGVGKEHVAHLLHERSVRAMGPLIPVNCAVFAGEDGLANSALFGHVKGAFTGAVADRDGAFKTAHGGILFLDEIGEMPVGVQAKLLRVLEDHRITPEGADKPRWQEVNVRVVAATNRDLPAMIRGGRFLADLYHRLDIMRLSVPPLREHPEDIPPIAEHALGSILGTERGAKLSKEDIACLQGYDWPGNTRQLIKVLKRSVHLKMPIPEVLEEERRIGALTPADNGQAQADSLLPRTADEIKPIREVQRLYAARALQLNGGNLTATAERLGIAVNTLRSYVDTAEAEHSAMPRECGTTQQGSGRATSSRGPRERNQKG